MGESQTEETEEENKMKRILIALTAGLLAVTAQADPPSAFNSPELKAWAAQDAEYCR
jgi:hypothetical protein